MIHTIVVAAADGITVLASVLYVRGTIRDTAQPQIVSWGSWAALLAESTAAEFLDWKIPAALYTGICAAACALITLLVLRRGSWVPSLLDKFSLAAVAAGLVLLIVVRDDRAVVLVTVLADLAAYLPTMKHAWTSPDEEPAHVYLAFGIGAAGTLWAAPLTVVGSAYPFYLTMADLLVVAFIVIQRHRLIRPMAVEEETDGESTPAERAG